MSRGRRVEKREESKARISEEILMDKGKEIVRSARRGGKGGSYAIEVFKQSECGARICNDKDVSDCS